MLDWDSPEAMSAHVDVLEHGYRLRRVFHTQADGDVDEDASEKGSEDTHSGAGR